MLRVLVLSPESLSANLPTFAVRNAAPVPLTTLVPAVHAAGIAVILTSLPISQVASPVLAPSETTTSTDMMMTSFAPIGKDIFEPAGSGATPCARPARGVKIRFRITRELLFYSHTGTHDMAARRPYS
jgi:hypothetical protein